jgi:hypothetical protein
MAGATVNSSLTCARYPAGFVYAYSALYYVTKGGVDIVKGQYIFAGLYVLTLHVIHGIYAETRAVSLSRAKKSADATC